MPRRSWTHDELVPALALYFQLPFGRLRHATPEVRGHGELIGRGENSAALRYLVTSSFCSTERRLVSQFIRLMQNSSYARSSSTSGTMCSRTQKQNSSKLSKMATSLLFYQFYTEDTMGNTIVNTDVVVKFIEKVMKGKE